MTFRSRIGALLLLGLLAGCAAKTAAPPLPRLNLDPARTTVSGFSSGAYMATQLHLAFSDHIAGVALVADGPYHCAEGQLDAALAHCMNPAADALPALAPLLATAQQRAARGDIAALTGLSGDRVFVLHGRTDSTVGAAVSRQSAQFYHDVVGAGLVDVVENDAQDFAHTFPTDAAGSDCRHSESPYLGRCGLDGALLIFRALYGEAATAVAGTAHGELREFDQAQLRTRDKPDQLADTGYVYVPGDCATGARCGLHIALHGCLQNAESVGQSFVGDAGYNRWADAYHVVVLYPQTHASYVPLNPKACWDWWGYTGADYDTRNGAQLRLIARAAAALGAPLE